MLYMACEVARLAVTAQRRPARRGRSGLLVPHERSRVAQLGRKRGMSNVPDVHAVEEEVERRFVPHERVVVKACHPLRVEHHVAGRH